MNYSKSILILLLVIFAFPSSGNAQTSKKHVLKIKKDHYYQLIKMSLMPNKESKALLDDYFMKIGPLIGESGAKVYSFAVQSAKVGKGPAQMFIIAEYQNKSKTDLIFQSEAFFKNRNQRDKALSYLSEGYFLATADGELDLSLGELRLISLWSKPEKANQLNEYFGTITQDAIDKGAIVPPFLFIPDPSNNGKSYDASMVMIAAWQTKKNEEKFYAGKLFKENVYKRDDALKFHEEYSIVYIPE